MEIGHTIRGSEVKGGSITITYHRTIQIIAVHTPIIGRSTTTAIIDKPTYMMWTTSSGNYHSQNTLTFPMYPITRSMKYKVPLFMYSTKIY